MKPWSSLVLAAALAVVAPALATEPDQHGAHHPAPAAASAPPAAPAMPMAETMPSSDGSDSMMAGMAEQMKTMQDMHARMMAAKTPAEREALMPEHMQAMRGGMALLSGSAADAPGGCDMGMHQQRMEQRMQMMEMMMTMMMDRLPAHPGK
jgi:hypothetical protein